MPISDFHILLALVSDTLIIFVTLSLEYRLISLASGFDEHSPGQEAGLREGDIFRKLGGQDVIGAISCQPTYKISYIDFISQHNAQTRTHTLICF